MRIGQTSFLTFLSQLVISAVGFAATIYFANVLGADILGQYYLLQAVVGWLSLVGSMGVGGAITKRMSEGNQTNKYKTAGGIVILLLTLSIIVSIIVFQNYINIYFGIQRIDFVILLLISALFSSYISAILHGEHLVHIDSILKPIRSISRTGLQVIGVALGSGLTALVLGYAVGGFIFIVIGVYVIGFSYSIPRSHHFKSLARYAKYASVGRLGRMTFQRADILILGMFVPNSLIGAYGITWSIANFLRIFSSSISGTIFPEVSKLANEDDLDEVANLAKDSISYAGLIAIPGLVGGLLLSDRILQIYGEGFARGADILGLLICATLFYGYQGQFTNILNGIDRPKDAFKVNTVLIGSNIIFNIILISRFGILGAAVASVSSTLLGTLLGYRLAQQHIPISISGNQILRQLLAALAMGIAIILLEKVINILVLEIPNWLTTGGLVLSGAIIYFSIMLGISHKFRDVVFRNISWI